MRSVVVDDHWVLMDALDSTDAVGSYKFAGSCGL